MRITDSELSAAESSICRGCAEDRAYENDLIGCVISLWAGLYGEIPSEWDMESMTCSEYEIGGES